METSASFDDTWKAYQQAVSSLYSAPARAAAGAERSGGQVYLDRLETSGQEVVNRSAEVRRSLESSLGSTDLDQRELATLKLLSAAAYDLSIASDLLEMAETQPSAMAERGGGSAVFASADLRSVLEAPMGAGLSGLLEVERGGLPNDTAGARAALEAAVTELLISAPQNAALTSQTAAVELGSIGFGPVKSAASLAVDAIIDKLPAGATPVSRRAAQIVLEGVQKLQSALGKDNEKTIRNQAAGWAEKIESDHGFLATLLDGLYETKLIGSESMDAISKAPETLQPAAFNTATQKLTDLTALSNKTQKTLSALLKVMAFVKVPLLAAAPWGTLGICAAYLGVLGYAVYSNGDILDWHRTGEFAWLDRVEGMRTALKKSLSG